MSEGTRESEFDKRVTVEVCISEQGSILVELTIYLDIVSLQKADFGVPGRDCESRPKAKRCVVAKTRSMTTT
jgi:hypothetical protein